MQFLRISDRFVNLERVAEFCFDTHGVTISYDHEHSTQITTRRDVILLRQWLEAQALDLANEVAASNPLDSLELDSLFETTSAGDTTHR